MLAARYDFANAVIAGEDSSGREGMALATAPIDGEYPGVRLQIAVDSSAAGRFGSDCSNPLRGPIDS